MQTTALNSIFHYFLLSHALSIRLIYLLHDKSN